MAEGFRISRDFAEQTVRTIKRVGDIPIGRDHTFIQTRFEDTPSPAVRLRLCKTTAAFNKSTIATLQVWEDGTPPNETRTADTNMTDVVNKYANIATGKFVSVAKHGNGRWYVVAAEC